jgi:lysyl-tRNA synthetase class 1
MLLNLASASSAENKDQMWGFIRKYAPEATSKTHPGLDAAAGYAVRYFHDFVKPTKVYRAANDQERAALEDLAAKLKAAGLVRRDLRSAVRGLAGATIRWIYRIVRRARNSCAD